MNCYAQSRVLSALIILFSLTACSGETTDSLPFPIPGQTTPVDEPTIDDSVDGSVGDTGNNNTDITPPSTPDNIRTTNITISSISFAWDAANDDVGVTAYRVYRDGSNTAFTTTTSLSLTVTNLSAGRSYEYSVSAVDAAGNESARSQVLSATTLIPVDSTAPTTPSALRATSITSNTASLAWNAASDNVVVTGYRLYKNGSSTPLHTTTALSFTDTSLSPEQSYQYRISAFDAAGNESPLSAALIVLTPAAADTSAPTTPTNLRSTSVTHEQINLAWNAASDNVGVTGYRLYKDGSNVAFATTTATSYSDTGLTAEQSYLYRVSAVDAAGNVSSHSSLLTVSTTAAPDTSAPTTPTSLRSTTVTHEQINLMWNAASDNVGVAGYRLYKNGSSTAFATTTTPGYNDIDLEADQSYQYRVSAVDAAGNESALSNSLLVNTLSAPDTSAPTTPTNLHSTTVSSDQIDLVWNVASDNIGVTAYRLYRNGSSTPLATTATPGYSDTGLAANQSYQYRVSAIDEAGNESSLSSAITVTTDIVSVPQTVNLSWQSPTRNTDNSCLSGIDGYRLSYGTSSGNYQTSHDLYPGNGDVSCAQTDYDATCDTPVMTCSYDTEPLQSGTWYFVTQTIDLSGTVSDNSNEISRQVN